MKRYSFKITRDTTTGITTIHPIRSDIPAHAKPFRVSYPRPYYAETLQIYNTRQEAENAVKFEKMALETSKLSPEALIDELAEILRKVADLRLSLRWICARTQISYTTTTSKITRKLPPDPRHVVKLRLVVAELEKVANFAGSVLPDSGACGNPRKGRGGRPEIWKEQKRFKEGKEA